MTQNQVFIEEKARKILKQFNTSETSFLGSLALQSLSIFIASMQLRYFYISLKTQIILNLNVITFVFFFLSPQLAS